ncbi:hypothetical protein L7F22_026793 [Adiantum nelumboides]|nr:hypothetical protein [Adiantum nelumboides]
MAPSPTDVSSALQSFPEKKDSLRKVFSELEEHRALIARCSGGWKELDTHLSEIHDALEKRYAEIVEKESKFEARMTESQADLDKRASVIESREQASLARVQEQKDAAVAAIREQKRKWIEERQLLQSQSPAKPDLDSTGSKSKQKESESHKNEAGNAKSGGNDKDDVSGNVKEASMKGKDDTNAKKSSKEIASAKGNLKDGANKTKKVKENSSTTPQKKEESLKPDDVAGSSQVCISKSEGEKERNSGTEVATVSKQENVAVDEAVHKQGLADENAHNPENQSEEMEVGDDDGIKSGDEDGSDEEEKEGSHKKADSSQSAIRVRPELISFCEKMDGPGLKSFLISHKKAPKFLRKELPIAMKSASNPAWIVVQAVKHYHSSESGSESAQAKALASRRACLALLDSLLLVLDGEKKAGKEVLDEVKEEAKKLAELWKSKLSSKENDLSAQVDVHSFLLLVATFGLASNFSEDELCDLVIPICFRRQIPKLCRKLGLAHKAPGLFQRWTLIDTGNSVGGVLQFGAATITLHDIVDRLIKDEKQIAAVSFIQEYKLAEKFEPVALLKAYLKTIRKSHTPGPSNLEEKDELHMKELNAARAVLKCLQKFKLEGNFPVEGLQRRIVQLEKVSTDKKRTSDVNPPSAVKKARPNGPAAPFRSSDRFGGRGMGGRNYGSPYGRGGRGGYPYPAGAPAFPSSYPHGNYHYGGGPPPYQGPYLR